MLPPDRTGITFSNRLSDATIARNRLLEIGSGVALGDVDGDDRVDLYLCGLENGNVLYRNLGDWRFEDITARAGVTCDGQFSTGCVLGDIDGDGDLDLLVNSLGGGTRLFLNDGRGKFSEATETGLQRRFGATSAALADLEGDGDLDLYVTNYRTDTFHDNPPGLRIEMRQLPDGSRAVEPRDRFITLPTADGVPMILEFGEPDLLYINRGGGRFVSVPWNTGLFLDPDGAPIPTAPAEWGLSVMFRDFNGDRLPDLYVCNDFVVWPDRLWINDGGQRFRAAPRTALRCVSLASMAVDVADINRDGHDDIFVADMLSVTRAPRAWQRPDTLGGVVRWPLEDPGFRPEVARNTLHLARGDGTYAEIARLAGVSATDWTPAALFMDVDLDGWEDLLVTAGNKHDVQDVDALARQSRGGRESTEARLANLSILPGRERPSMALRNRRDLTFEDASAAWGFGISGLAHGMALGDLDSDGDMDVIINCMNAPARVLRNDTVAPRVAVRLRGIPPNTRGIGARITVRGGPVAQTQEMIAGGRFASSDDPMRVFAAGESRRLEIQVDWRGGLRSLITNVVPNRLYEILESAAARPTNSVPPRAPPLFEDVSERLHHQHVDTPFDDFARHPLLPRKLSTLGPGVAWSDLDGDGRDDLLIGGGAGGRLAVFRNEGSGGLNPWPGAAFETNRQDQTGIVVWQAANGATLLIGESGWESPDTKIPSFRSIALGPDGSVSNLPPTYLPGARHGPSVIGPLALADIDGDGDLDLFAGGRVVTARYPEPSDSFLLRNEGEGFPVDRRFEGLGMVSGAVFTDFDADGDPDLVLACDWDSLRLLENRAGEWIEATARVGLDRFRGWWNGVTAGDFDGDGRMDLAASNWGRNWRIDQPPAMDLPVHLFHGEFAGDGVLHALIASPDPVLSKVTPWRERQAVLKVFPALAASLPTHHAYGEAGVPEILGDQFAGARELQAATMDSMVFLNRGGKFEARPLPVEAQFSAAFGLNAGDFDGDGNEDLFLAQNFFGIDPENSRLDAGTGLILLGDGTGAFRALSPLASGIRIPGEQRGSAIADFDGDGRIDLAVGQNAGAIRLFRNARARPGVRLRLRDGPANPRGIGAVVRLRFSKGLGPAREVHAGSGYWSQDSDITVLAATEPPVAVQVRWPGGRQDEWQWPSGARSVTITRDGVRISTAD